MPNITISLSAENATRVASAVGGNIHEGGEPASPAEVLSFIRRTLKTLVLNYERSQSAATFVEQPYVDD
jgi:hypothetical protein